MAGSSAAANLILEPSAEGSRVACNRIAWVNLRYSDRNRMIASFFCWEKHL